MELFDVYPLFDIEIVKGRGVHTYDAQGTEYLDLYGGHAVISVGHSHPHYVEALRKQSENLVFYSNSVINSLQQKLADKLGKEAVESLMKRSLKVLLTEDTHSGLHKTGMRV